MKPNVARIMMLIAAGVLVVQQGPAAEREPHRLPDPPDRFNPAQDTAPASRGPKKRRKYPVRR
jgi:hypothetical protein